MLAACRLGKLACATSRARMEELIVVRISEEMRVEIVRADNMRRRGIRDIAQTREDIGKREEDRYEDFVVCREVRPCCWDEKARSGAEEAEEENLFLSVNTEDNI